MFILFNCYIFKYFNIIIYYECGFIDKKIYDYFFKLNKGIFFNR